MKYLALSASLIPLSLVLVSNAAAQGDIGAEAALDNTAVEAARTLGTVTVTAQRRAESINDVPIAINALDGDALEEAGIADTDDIVASFPNLGLNERSGYNSGVSIRGVGTDNFHISGQQSVGTYIDDVSIVSPFVSTIGVYDIDRVEVLRGPQNTLYGRNTTGGAMVWHTNKARPGDGTNGYGSVGVGNGGLFEFEAAVGFDVSDNFAVRIAGMSDSFDGLWEDAITGDATGNGYDRKGVRVNLQYDISDNTNLNIGVSHGTSDGQDTAYAYRGNRLSTGAVDPRLNSAPVEDSAGRNDNYVMATAAEVAASSFLSDQFNRGTGMVIVNPMPGPFNRLINYSTDFGKTYVHPEAGYEAEWNGIRANVSHEFQDFADLTVLASYDETTLFGVNIADLTGFGAVQDGDWEVMQLETRLASNASDIFRWIVGGYYSTEESKQDTWVRNGGAAGGQGVAPGIDIDSEYDNFSIYGQADYQVTDALNFTAGLRYTEDELKGDWFRTVCGFARSVNGVSNWTRDVRANGCPGFTGPGQIGPRTAQTPTQELKETGWKVGADYKIGDTLLYASVSRGFKGGAYDNRPLATGELPIGPEFLNAYEVGFKSTLADNRIQLNGATFYYTWEDLQLFDIIGGSAALLNVPETELIGAELDAKIILNDNWLVQAAVGVVESEVTDISGLPVGSNVAAGDEISNTPNLTANFLANYTTDFAEGELSFTGSWRYASEYFYDFSQTTARDTAPSQNYVNADVAYSFGDSLQHSIRLYGKNLTEEFHCSGIQDGPASGQNYSCRIAQFGERQIGLNLKTNF